MKNVLVSVVLVAVLCMIIVGIGAAFVSGPAIKSEQEFAAMTHQIQGQLKEEPRSIVRHVLSHITYIAEMKQEWVWFNEKGEEILRKEKKDEDIEKVKQIASIKYQIESADVAIAYAYKNGAYEISDDTTVLLFDIDSLETVYYRRK